MEATSTLSLPTLAIHDENFLGREVFIQFVDDVLISGDLKFLKNFGLNCWTFNLLNDNINIWIDALINSKVEHLEICVNLPSLEVLHLNNVTLPDINCLAMLLSGCAFLEMLVLTDLDMNNYGPTQETRKLNRLVTAIVPPSLVPLEALSNVTFLSLQLFCRFPHEPILNVPPCLSSHLKKLTIGDFQLHEAYVAFMKFILNNAQVLSSVKITSGYTLSSEVEIPEMIKVISVYPRASENCKFLHDISPCSSRKDWDRRFRF
ncbi:hypothetical protein K1719_016288 [Acacia pycnantha]|nr:hypothetical protein K1719_016288 [Acacia pycnantha]